MVCVLAPPNSVAAAATAPAGVSPAVAALVGQQASKGQDTTPNSSNSSSSSGSSSTDANEQLKAARVWSCLPLLCVSTSEAHQELNALFNDMRAAGIPGGDNTSDSSSSGSSVAKAVSMQHMQSFLWDCLYMAHGVSADSALSCIPQLAEKLKAAASSTGPLVGTLYERATVWALDTCSGSSSSRSSSKDVSSSSSRGTRGGAARQAITAGLLKLLVGRCMSATIQQLQAAVAGSAARSAPGTAAGSGAVKGTKSLTPSPVAASSRGSYDSSHPSAGSLTAANSLAGWHAPVHCRDAVSPVASLQQQQQQQGAQFLPASAAAGATMVPVSAAEAGFYAAHRRHSADGLPHPQADHTQGPGMLSPCWSPTAGASFVPMSAAAAAGLFPAASSAQVAASAALFNAHRRLSMDNLPLPNTGYTGGQSLHPPRWSVDLPLPRPPLQHAQQQAQQQAYSISPSSLMGASLLNTTSPTGMAAAAGAGAASASYAAHMALQAWPPSAGMGPSSLLPVQDGAAAAAAAAGAAAAQAALLHMQSGAFSSQGTNLQSPAVRGNLVSANAASSGSSSSRYAQQGSPMHPAMAHMRSQGSLGSLGYSPSLASSLGNSAFLTAEASGGLVGGMAAAGGGGGYRFSTGPGGRSPPLPSAMQPLPRTMQGAGHGAAAAGGSVGGGERDEYGSVEGRHWAVFDTTGVEGFDAGAGEDTFCRVCIGGTVGAVLEVAICVSAGCIVSCSLVAQMHLLHQT
jgi:hypothetical protein